MTRVINMYYVVQNFFRIYLYNLWKFQTRACISQVIYAIIVEKYCVVNIM